MWQGVASPAMSNPPKIETLVAELEIMLGRINGLHEVLWHLAGALPPELAARAIELIEQGHPKVQADLLAAPVAERTISEHQRIVAEALQILRGVASRG